MKKFKTAFTVLFAVFAMSTAVYADVDFNAQTGELTLSGTLTADEVKAYADNAAVKSVKTSGNTVFPKDCSYMFYNFKAESMDFTGADTSAVTDMNTMFAGCDNLRLLNVGDLNTANVEDMSYMFTSCYALETLDISNFDTRNVTTIKHMFSDMHSLKSLDLSTFLTSKVNSMSYAFANCHKLKTLDISNFNTENTEDMEGMFNQCYSLESLDLGSFKTQNTVYMDQMFCGCKSLKTLDVTNFNTSNVTSMSSMFEDCFSLESIDLSSFDTSSTKTMSYMFAGCRKLKSLDLSNFDRTNCRYSESNMFSGCYRLESLTIGEKYYNVSRSAWLPNRTTGWALKGSTERLSSGTNAYIENTGKNTYIKLPEEILYGDIDLDNMVMDDDALLLLKYFNGMAELDEGQLAAAKITDHSKAKPDILDAIKIIQTA